MIKKISIIVICLLNLCSGLVYSQTLNTSLTENSKVSLLTCTPNSDAIYALFGHTGLRVQDDSIGIDLVFDYGVFDFSSGGFIYRFVKGETDYMVGARTYQKFLFEYRFREMGVDEQIINLTLRERQEVFNALLENLKPENRVYRYNFFYDNCATRPRDIIQSNVNGTINYKPYTTDQTYRDLLEECLDLLTPWSRFGINLVIGSGADKIITERQKDFLPQYVSNAFDHATTVSIDGKEKPLVLSQSELLAASSDALKLIKAKEEGIKSPNYPLYVGLLLLLLALLISYLQYFKKKDVLAKLFDTLLFIMAGFAGCIIFFLMFFSEHPCVDANWNLIWLNPLALLFALFFFAKFASKYVICYHFTNFAVLTVFLGSMLFIPQSFEVAFIPYILTLWLRSGINVLTSKKELK